MDGLGVIFVGLGVLCCHLGGFMVHCTLRSQDPAPFTQDLEGFRGHKAQDPAHFRET